MRVVSIDSGTRESKDARDGSRGGSHNCQRIDECVTLDRLAGGRREGAHLLGIISGAMGQPCPGV
jgi:hypothetical protein